VPEFFSAAFLSRVLQLSVAGSGHFFFHAKEDAARGSLTETPVRLSDPTPFLREEQLSSPYKDSRQRSTVPNGTMYPL